MRRIAILMFTLAAVSVPPAQASDPVGFREITLSDGDGRRPLHVSLWYPTVEQGPMTLVGENAVLYGLSVVADARPAHGPHPLVVLSHGFGGSWRNLNWLAGELVKNGYAVAAPDHPGTTTSDRRPSEAIRLWERPRDLSRVIDGLVADPELSGGVAADRIAAVGHSLGGWTVVGLAGGRFEAQRLTPECPPEAGSPLCAVLTELGIVGNVASAELAGDLRDARIGAVVSLDLGPARGFTPESLARIRLPMLVLAAGKETAEIAASTSDSIYIADNLPVETARYVQIADATHFSFMQLCKPDAIDLIEEESPGEGYVCTDGGTRGRAAIHRQIADMIIAFLADALPAH